VNGRKQHKSLVVPPILTTMSPSRNGYGVGELSVVLATVSRTVAFTVATAVGCTVGSALGVCVGIGDGIGVGIGVGLAVGCAVGISVAGVSAAHDIAIECVATRFSLFDLADDVVFDTNELITEQRPY
jgi:hypothetical protein